MRRVPSQHTFLPSPLYPVVVQSPGELDQLAQLTMNLSVLRGGGGVD